MERNNISKIVRSFLSGRFPADTEERVQRWMISDSRREEKEQASFSYWNELEAAPDHTTYQALERVNRRIGQLRLTKRTPWHRQLARIAAVLVPLFLLIGGYHYYRTSQPEWVEIHVAYGEKRQLFLPDNTEIWINAGSTLKYPKAFKGEERRVILAGEAYFAVEKDATKPFVVQTDQLAVEVLGTEFNVKAYPDDERVVATLNSGKVKITTENQERLLQPNEQLCFDKRSEKMSVTEIPPHETKGWLSGQLLFTDASFHEIKQTLERKFTVSFDTSTFSLSEEKRYTIKFYQDESLEEILSVMQDVVGFNWRIKKDTIVIKE